MNNKIYIALGLSLIALPAFANMVPLSEAQRYIDAMPNGVPPLYTCADKPEEPCFDSREIIWEEAEIVTIHDQDPETGINHPRKVLRNSEEKIIKLEKDKSDKEKAEKDKKDAKELLKAKIKSLKKSDLTSNAKTVDALMDIIELLKD